MLFPGWGGLIGGTACDVGGCGEKVGAELGGWFQFFKDGHNLGLPSLMDFHYRQALKKACGQPKQ
jgi:hypothetical protein